MYYGWITVKNRNVENRIMTPIFNRLFKGDNKTLIKKVIWDFTGRFKKGLQNFKTELQPLNSQELLKLLQSTDHDEEVRGREGHVINKRDLDKLLDRSSLMKKFEELKLRRQREKGKDELRTCTSRIPKVWKIGFPQLP